jgi:hypothetical protein
LEQWAQFWDSNVNERDKILNDVVMNAEATSCRPGHLFKWCTAGSSSGSCSGLGHEPHEPLYRP